MTRRARSTTSVPFNFEVNTALFYLFMVLSLFLMMDPFYTGHGPYRLSRDLGPIKYLGLMAGLAALFVSAVAIAINGRTAPVPWKTTLRRIWPLLLFAALVLSGSIWARVRLDIKETYLPMGLAMLSLPTAVIVFWAARDKLKIPRRFLQMLLIAVPYALAWIVIKRLQGGQAFHTEMFLLVPLMVYFHLGVRRRWLAWPIVLLCFVTGVAGHKNTAYLITLVALAHVTMVSWLRFVRVRDLTRRALLWFLLIVLVASTMAVVGFLLINRETYLPSGNVEVRTYTYGEALERFLENPVYGTAYADTSLVFLQGVEVLGRPTVVSHSDFLDVLSHGGLIGIFLFVLGFAGVLWRALAALRNNPSEQGRALIHGLLAVVSCGLLTSLFNSPLISVSIAVLFWFAVGLLAAVSEYELSAVRQASRAGASSPDLVERSRSRHGRRRALPVNPSTAGFRRSEHA